MSRIVLVDDDYVNLTNGKNVLKEQYEVLTVPSGAKLFELLEQTTPDLILLDIEMPEMDGYTVLKRLKADPQTASIPVIFLTVRIDVGSELEGLSLGAVDYISKPFSPPLLLKRVETHLLTELQKAELRYYSNSLAEMVSMQTQTITELQSAVLHILSSIIEYRDGETGSHVWRTQQYFSRLIDGMKERQFYQNEIDLWDIPLTLLSSQLHDIGKIGIPDAILLKPGELTPEEFEIIKKHTVIGGEIIDGIEAELKNHQFIQYAKTMIVSHHEKWDGTGYPFCLSEHQIPLQGRCMAIVDVYDALISKRPYKKAFTHQEAMEIIVDGKGKHFDPLITEAFISISDKIQEKSVQVETEFRQRKLSI
jgi:putative two-component system response regulator